VPVIHRFALLPFPAPAVFDIVGDVERYPEFLRWCRNARVLERHGQELVAELELDARGVRDRFTTRNVMVPHERIELHLVDGPFRAFEGAWHFKALGGDAGCRVALDLEFEFSGARALLGSIFPKAFSNAADQMVDAFSLRARALLE
jgi:ribosome-associated toxin RatA of RatAB toxin-antitoxin module